MDPPIQIKFRADHVAARGGIPFVYRFFETELRNIPQRHQPFAVTPATHMENAGRNLKNVILHCSQGQPALNPKVH